ncbi:MAG: hypothetical protein JST47_05680 [Bacteroidetes bacterium]|nr:hypothetical protein [Bacteroidota bacterium]
MASVISLTCHSVRSQSIVGSWKTVSNIIEDVDGKSRDMSARLNQKWPCLAELQTIFNANGTQVMKSPKNCGPIDYNKLPASTWKMIGNTISITNNSMPSPLGNTATYSVKFIGNRAIFIHEYTREEKIKLHTPNAKKLVITYQKF